MRIVVASLCCFSLTNLPGQSSGDFQPFPGDSAKLYQFDLYKNYFINDHAEFKERTDLVRAFEDLDKRLITQSKSDNKNLYPLIREFDSLNSKIGKHSTYLGMFAYIDLSNPLYQMKMDSFDRRVSPILNRISELIITLPLSSITKKGQRNPLGPYYRFFYAQLRSDPMRRLPENERRIINDITPNLINWQARLFQTTTRTTPFKPVKTKTGTLNLPSNVNEIFNHPDREVRKEGYLNNLEGIWSRREIYAAILLETVRNRNRLAALMGFKDYPDQFYSERFLTRQVVNTLLKTLADSAHINKRFENVWFDNLKKTGGSIQFSPGIGLCPIRKFLHQGSPLQKPQK